VQSLLINRAMVHGVAETPNGAHFTTCPPDYARDEEFQKQYVAASGDPAAWRSFTERFLDVDESGYQQAVREFTIGLAAGAR
jgi:glutaconate CoA-transferase subunit A